MTRLRRGYTEWMELLLEFEADMNAITERRYSAVMVMVQCELLEMLHLFVANGTNLRCVNTSGLTSLLLAIDYDTWRLRGIWLGLLAWTIRVVVNSVPHRSFSH